MRPWYQRPWGIAILVYIAVTASLGIVFLVAIRRAQPQSSSSALRAGGFTEAGQSASGAALDRSVPMFSDRDPAIGAPLERAKLIIVEYSDFQCPFCRAAFPIIREAVTMYGDRGLRFVYRDFPVDEIHADARLAAEAAQCAHAQGKFWAYHDKVFQSADASGGASGLDEASLLRYAEQVGIDRAPFEECIRSKQFASEVAADYDAGVKLGVRGTPTWFLLPGGDPAKARRVEGVIPRASLQDLMERALR
ncbi:MAG: thioredoxin domain-containing protein [bacterium]|nr:thioredoxin domain-containing protein [bacterium]